MCFSLVVLSTCGQKATSEQDQSDTTVHLVFHPTFSMPLPEGFSLSEIAVRRVDCESQDEGIEHVLGIVQNEGVFVFNVPESEVRECGVLLRRVVLKSSTSTQTYNLVKQTRSEKGSRELLLAPDEGTAGLVVTLPEKNSIRVNANSDWPLNFAFSENRDGRFPRTSVYTESGSVPLNLRLASVEDRGVVSGSWREYGITLTCDGWSKFLECEGRSLLRILAKLVREQDIAGNDPNQVRIALAQTQLQFESTISHFIGSGLRFTMLFPLAWQGQSLSLLVGTEQVHNVFKIDQNLVPSTNQ